MGGWRREFPKRESFLECGGNFFVSFLLFTVLCYYLNFDKKRERERETPHSHTLLFPSVLQLINARPFMRAASKKEGVRVQHFPFLVYFCFLRKSIFYTYERERLFF